MNNHCENCNKSHLSNSTNLTNLQKYDLTHEAKALILSCIDYRFIDNTINFLEMGPFANNFDFTALPGASLGYNQDKFKHWGQTFIDIINLAIELHEIKQITVFDHMDCGAYQLLYPDLTLNTLEEKMLHYKNIKIFINSLKQKYPKLLFSGYLVNYDGTVEKVPIV